MTKALLVTERWLVENSVINENVSYALVRPTLVKVQEMRVQPILGSTLYNEIATQVVSGTTTALNQTLLDDYIAPVIREWMYLELPHVLAFKTMNQGMVRRRSQDADIMDMGEMQRVIDKARNDAEWYSERLTRYLCENSTDYPLFENPGSGLDVIKPRKQNYTTGLNLRLNRRYLNGYSEDANIYGWRDIYGNP